MFDSKLIAVYEFGKKRFVYHRELEKRLGLPCRLGLRIVLCPLRRLGLTNDCLPGIFRYACAGTCASHTREESGRNLRCWIVEPRPPASLLPIRVSRSSKPRKCTRRSHRPIPKRKRLRLFLLRAVEAALAPPECHFSQGVS